MMNTLEVNNLSEFVRAADQVGFYDELVLFRGQAVPGNLLPNICRRHPSFDSSKKEEDALNQFALLGAALLPHYDLSKVDQMILAQHHGLKTRLLDWTTNALAALWFACCDSVNGDVFVYALNAGDFIDPSIYERDPFKVNKTRVIQPRHNNPRIIAQAGWFTLHRFSSSSNCFVPLEKNGEISSSLTEIKIPREARDSIIASLARHGVSRRSLFPDLTGLCLDLNNIHRL
jgi:FRG domain